MERWISVLGLFVMLGLAWLLSTHKKKAFQPRLIFFGLGLQLLLGWLILRTETGERVFDAAKRAFVVLLGFTQEGSRFLFGSLADGGGMGFMFAFQIIPTIIFFSSLMAIFYHLGIMQWVVNGMAWVMHRLMRTSGSESLSMAANVFVGQTEAPLVVRPYVPLMTKSELMALMTGGMATVAGGVLAAYVDMGIDAGHLLTASVMSAPAALLIAKIMIPETEESVTAGSVKMKVEKISANVIDAACRGAGDGLKLALNVGAMLLAFIALVAMANYMLGAAGLWVGMEDLTLEKVFGVLFAPLAWVMGVPWEDCTQVGNLLGQKTIVNEFVAYMSLAKEQASLHPRSVTIATYALCGFANFSSIAIQIGGIGGIAPDRRSDLAKLGLRAMIGGALAAFMTATVAGIMLYA